MQWEDFSKHNASRLLERYRDRLCTFNDDIQGTGAVTLAGLLAAMKVTGSQLSKQRVAILGAGSAAIGISDQIVAGMMREGLSETEARSQIWLVDSRGLVHSGRTNLEPAKQRYAQPIELLNDWKLERPDQFTLKDLVANALPRILIGTSAQPGAFSRHRARNGPERETPSDLSAFQSDVEVRSHARRYPELDEGTSAGRDRESFRSGNLRLQDLHNWTVQ